MMRAVFLALASLALVGGGCDGDDGLPAACTSGADSVRRALRAAPGAVRLEGVPLSRCLTKEADSDDVQLVGGAYVEAAAGLARRAADRSEGRASLELGYLIGAVRRGAGRSQGVHSELVRRLEQELGTVDTGSRAFRRGERAGRRRG